MNPGVVGNDMIKEGDKVLVTVRLHNAGDMDGNEIIQLYLTYPDAVRNSPFFALNHSVKSI